MNSPAMCPTTNEPLFPLLNCSRLRIGSDGIGVTTLIAGAGCPLDCRWCINNRLLREAPSRPVTAEELYDLVKIDDLYFQATGGGVTFGGGESLLHAAFIKRFKELLPAEWKINAETSLAVPQNLLQEAIDAVDLFIVDCKDMNPAIYQKYTGSAGTMMKNNIRYLAETIDPEKVFIRIPLIPEYNTEEDRQNSLAELREMGFTRFDLFEYIQKE